MVRRGKKGKKKVKPEAFSSAPPPPPPPPFPPPSPPWVDLPQDITADILERLEVADILDSAQKVCTTWRSVCKEPFIFREMHLSLSTYRRLNFQILWRHAIDRSQGQLQHLSIDHRGDASFLDYVAQRSPQLRYLTLSGCRVTGEDLVQAIKKFPLLQELRLYHIPVAGELIEQIGTSCPLLKSFTYYKQGSVFHEEVCDIEALAIAKTMPGLRYLCLFGNRMSNQALVAILDACVHLESLDLRLCFNVDLSGDLDERCCRQIKDMKKSSDFTAVWHDFNQEMYGSYNIYDHYGRACDIYSPDSGVDHRYTSDWLKMFRFTWKTSIFLPDLIYFAGQVPYIWNLDHPLPAF